MKSVEIVGLHLEATTGTPVLLLRELDEPHRVLPIFIGGEEAASIGVALLGHVPPRPLTHDVMAELVRSLDAEVTSAEVTELREGAFFAQLSLHGPAGGLRLDTRPSDAIALAVRVGAPLYVSDDVMDEAASLMSDDGPGVEPTSLDEAEIEEALEEFRGFLDAVEPGDFASDASEDAGEEPSAGEPPSE